MSRAYSFHKTQAVFPIGLGVTRQCANMEEWKSMRSLWDCELAAWVHGRPLENADRPLAGSNSLNQSRGEQTSSNWADSLPF